MRTILAVRGSRPRAGAGLLETRRRRSRHRVWPLLAVTALVVSGLAGASQTAAAAATSPALQPAQGQFVPLPGTALWDSRGNGTPGSAITGAPTSITLNPASAGVPANASAVVLEYDVMYPNFQGSISSTSTSAGDLVTAMRFPKGEERNSFDSAVPDSSGKITIRLNDNAGASTGDTTGLVVRVHGYYTGANPATAGSTYVGFPPELTWNGTGLNLNTSTTTVPIDGQGSIPAASAGSVAAVAVELNVIGPVCDGEMSVVPSGSTRTDRDVSFTAGDNITVFDLVQPDANGNVDVKLWNKGTCSTSTASGQLAQIRVRARGYFAAPTTSSTGSTFTSTAGDSLVDTTPSKNVGTDLCPSYALGTQSPRMNAIAGCPVQVTGHAGVPSSGVTGVLLDVIALNVPTNAVGDIDLGDTEADANTSTVTYNGESQISNYDMATYASLGSDGKLYFLNNGNMPVDVVIRVRGYYTAPTAPQAPVVAQNPDGSTGPATWTAPADGGSAISGFTVTADSESSDDVFTATVGPDATSYTFPSLDSTQFWDFEVTATNAVGDSPVGSSDQLATDAPVVTDDSSTQATPSQPQTAIGYFTQPDGTPVAGAQVLVFPGDDDSDQVDPLASVTTDSQGMWSYTPPSYSQLSASVQTLVDAAGGYLNLEVNSSGSATVSGTNYPEDASAHTSVWVGTATQQLSQSPATPEVTTESFTAEQDAGDPATVANLGTSDPSTGDFASVMPRLAANGAATDGGASTEDLTPSTNSYGLQTTASGGTASPYVATDGTNLANATVTATPMGVHCYKQKDNKKYDHAWTVVGAYHLWWDVQGGMRYNDGASSDVSVEASADGIHWGLNGSTTYSNSTGHDMGFEGKGPYDSHRLLVDLRYMKYRDNTYCDGHVFSKGKWVITELGLHNTGGGTTYYKTGKDISYQDGATAKASIVKNHYGWLNRVPKGGTDGLSKGADYSVAEGVNIFGVGISVKTARSTGTAQVITAGTKSTRPHWVWGNHGSVTNNNTSVMFND